MSEQSLLRMFTTVTTPCIQSHYGNKYGLFESQKYLTYRVFSPPVPPSPRPPPPGLQDVLPEFLRGRFVEAALSYVACNSEGDLLCRNNDCWCRCSSRFPECNCPFADIKVMEENLEKSKEAWNNLNQEFMESGRLH